MLLSVDCKRGQRKEATSKIVKKYQKYFWRFSTFFAQGHKRQKSSKSVKNIFDNFRAAPVFRLLLGGSDIAGQALIGINQFWSSALLAGQIILGVAPANQTKEKSHKGIPEQKFNVNRACFPKEKHQNSQKWAKFMNFSFWPFLWFGLLGRTWLLESVWKLIAPAKKTFRNYWARPVQN